MCLSPLQRDAAAPSSEKHHTEINRMATVTAATTNHDDNDGYGTFNRLVSEYQRSVRKCQEVVVQLHELEDLLNHELRASQSKFTGELKRVIADLEMPATWAA